MQKEIKNYAVFIILISVLIIPSFVFAAWYNPFSWNWNIFNIFSKSQTNTVQQNQKQNITTQTTNLQESASEQTNLNIEKISLNDSQAKDILWGDTYRPKIVIAGYRNYSKDYIMSHNKGYILSVGGNSSDYGLDSIQPNGKIVNLFNFHKSLNANFPIIYEQGQEIIVLEDKESTENWGAVNFKFTVFDKDSKKLTNFSLNLPKVGKANEYTYREFEDGIGFPYSPRQLAVYNNKFYVAITDLQNKDKGTTVYQYDLNTSQWNKFVQSQHPEIDFTMAINGDFLYWQEQYVCSQEICSPSVSSILYSKPLFYRIKLQ